MSKGPESTRELKRGNPSSPATSSPAQLAENIDAQVGSLAAASTLLVNNAGPSIKGRATAHGCSLYDVTQRTRLSQHFAATKDLLDSLILQVHSGELRDVQVLSTNTTKYATEIMHDTDSTITSTAEQAPNPDFIERSIRMSVMGMSLAMEMGWDEPNVREVGLCGLIHDWGMFRLPKKLQNPNNLILAADWSSISSHSLHTVDMISALVNISNEVRLAVSQVHENPDGSGYPYGLTKERIHPYAAILHVVDAYITLTSEMRGRKAFLPYDVMVYLLRQVKLHRMDEGAMRSLLNSVSLFPIGSYVQLTDGSEAQVIRRSTSHYTAPVVLRLSNNRQASLDWTLVPIIDLAQGSLRIASPISSPVRQEARITEAQMEQVLWDGTDG